MANDRLYLVCPHCGAGYMLAKHFADEWYTSSSKTEKEFVDGLNAFFAEHYRCMVGEVDNPHKFLLLNELEQMEFEEAKRIHSLPDEPLTKIGNTVTMKRPERFT